MSFEEIIVLPELQILEYEKSANVVSYGSNQQIYKSLWRRQSGCGPSTAANMFMYASWCKRHSTKNIGLCGVRDSIFNENAVRRHMDNAWEHITPGLGGVNSTQKFACGANGYATERKMQLEIHSLDVQGRCSKGGLPFKEFISFICDGLLSGCPVAFLNLCSGNVKNLDTWHWVTIVGLHQAEGYSATIFDEGNKKEIDIALWFETSKRGGGLVYFDLSATKKA